MLAGSSWTFISGRDHKETFNSKPFCFLSCIVDDANNLWYSWKTVQYFLVVTCVLYRSVPLWFSLHTYIHVQYLECHATLFATVNHSLKGNSSASSSHIYKNKLLEYLPEAIRYPTHPLSEEPCLKIPGIYAF